MSRKLKSVIGIVLVVVGVVLLLYPSVSNWLAEQSRSVVLSDYQDTVAGTNEVQLEEAFEKACDYNSRLRRGIARVTDPFDPSAQKVTDTDYLECLNILGNGVMGSISISSIKVTMPIYHGTSDNDLQHGVGHLQGTALPVGGNSTHCVIAGHTGLPTAKIFDALGQVKQGDVFVLSILNKKLAYQVCDISIVLPEETDKLAVQEGRDLVTLVTCTPYGKNTHRLLVTGERCDVPADEGNEADLLSQSFFNLSLEQIALLVAIAVIAVGVISGAVLSRGKSYKAGKRSGFKHGDDDV